MAISTLDSLLPEIFTCIIDIGFTREQDLEFLWTECRNVSKSWRIVIEDFVRRRHLPKTSIIYHITPRGLENIAELDFVRTHPDDEGIAIFMEKYGSKKSRAENIRTIKHKIEDGSSTYWPQPAHIVSIRRMTNDTEIPGIRVDVQKQEIRCNWKGMFTAFLSEHKLYSKLVDNWRKENPPYLKTSVDINLKTIQSLCKTCGASSGVDYNLMRDVRRKRVKWQLEHDNPHEYTLDAQDEKKALDRIREMRYQGLFLDRSDHEDVEENEDGTGTDSNDGWMGENAPEEEDDESEKGYDSIAMEDHY